MIRHSNGSQTCKCCGARFVRAIGRKEGFSFWECPECKFIFTDGVSYEEMVEKYQEGYHGCSEGAPRRGWLRTACFLDPALELLGDRRLKILDFGCGESGVWKELRRRGHDSWGVDIVAPRRRNPCRLTGDIMELDLPEEEFDLIYSFQVFEHIPEPLPVVRELLRILKPDGLLLVHTDMEVGEREENFFNWWYVLPPDHCSYYRHESFEKMAADSGDQIVYKSEKSVIIRKTGRAKQFLPSRPSAPLAD